LNESRIPDPFQYRAIWGVPVADRHAFDLLVARQMIWLPYAAPGVRRLLFTEDEQPICPDCEQIVAPGAASVVGMAVLADRELQQRLRADSAAMFGRAPDGYEAWWLVHGDCFDGLTRARIAELNQRIELALRAEERSN
jgi:hypothetical protein